MCNAIRGAEHFVLTHPDPAFRKFKKQELWQQKNQECGDDDDYYYYGFDGGDSGDDFFYYPQGHRCERRKDIDRREVRDIDVRDIKT